ncbi:MAG: SDR family NAD(P)-dependent oxidoreductase [Proteobacteria bacterium]|nr:SDR family NAD(P)-dependent oxidoreductase [Pseudomonadota bacterium]
MRKKTQTENKDIAIVGMACRFPDAGDYHAFWENIKNGVNSIREITPDRWDIQRYYHKDRHEPNRSVSKWCGLVGDVDAFDNPFFHISNKETEAMDPQQRLLLEETWHCMEDSGIHQAELQDKRTSVYVGAMAMDHLNLAGHPQIPADTYNAFGSYGFMLANRISYTLGLSGISCSLDAACASSLVAVHQAKQALLAHDTDYVFAGAVSLNLHPFKYVSFSKMRLLSPDGQCKTFDKDANGYVPGDGIGVVLLQRLEDALKAGNHIHGIIKGSAVNYTASEGTVTTPAVRAQCDVITQAYHDAHISPETVSYIEAHGTGTALGDPIEIEALTRFFKKHTDKKNYCKIGSVKTNIGHTESVAGMAGLIKVLLMMKHQQIASSLNCKTVNPVIHFDDSPFTLAKGLENWTTSFPLRAGVSAFGGGGVNAHVVLEQHVYRPVKHELSSPSYPFLLSAKSESSLADLIERWRNFVNTEGYALYSLGDLAKTLATGRESFDHRFGGLIGSHDELRKLLNHAPHCFSNTRKTTFPLRVGEYDWMGWQDIQPLLGEGFVAKELGQMEILLEKIQGSQRALQDFHKKKWPVNRRKLYRFMVGYAFLKSFFETSGFYPEWIRGEGCNSGVWTALALSGMIPCEMVLAFLSGKKTEADITLGRPRIAFLDPVTQTILRPCSFTARYVRGLLENLTVPDETVAIYHLKGKQLSESLFSFKEYIREWDDILRPFEITLKQLMDSPLKKETYLFAVIMAHCIRKLNRTWHFTEATYEASPEFYELVNLVTDHVMSPETLVELFVNEQPEYEAAAASLDQNRKNGSLHSHYSLLMHQPFEAIPNIPAWLKQYENTPVSSSPNSSCIDFGKFTGTPEGCSVNINMDNDPGAILENLMLSLWLNGVDIEFKGIYPPGTFQKLALPVYPFQKITHPMPGTQVHGEIKCQIPEALHPVETDIAEKSLDESLDHALMALLISKASGILNVNPEHMDCDSELGDFGFDSITWADFADQLNELWDLELSPALFFEYSTIREVARYLVTLHGERLAEYFTIQVKTERYLPDSQDTQENLPVQDTQASRLAQTSPEPSTSDNQPLRPGPIAVIGMSGTFPLSDDVDAFWKNLVQGKDCIREVPKDRWDWTRIQTDDDLDRDTIKWGGFIDDVAAFDPLFFGISPKEAELMDPQQRLLMMHVWKAMEDAGYASGNLAGTPTAIFVGTDHTGYGERIIGPNQSIDSVTSMGLLPSMGPNRMSWFLDLHGPSEPVETACSSSLVAIHKALAAIRDGLCDMAFAGGINSMTTPTRHISFGKAGMLSRDGRCKTFSHNADGYVRGEGAGMLLLKRLDLAESDGDPIHGLLLSSAVNHGGRSHSPTAPNPKAQADLLVSAYRRAGIDPGTVGYMEAHGTGTALGDPVEINALKTAFDTLYRDAGKPEALEPHCGLGSVKTNIGHLELAAGIAGVIKVLLQMKHKTRVKSLHCDTVNPYITLEKSPFYIQRDTGPWPSLEDGNGNDLPRRAGVSSFGFGGVNAHVVMEEYTGPAVWESELIGIPILQPVLIPLSAKTGEQLNTHAWQLIRAIKTGKFTDRVLSSMAYTLQTGRDAMAERLVIIAGSVRELADKLKTFIDHQGHPHPAKVEGLYRGRIKADKELLSLFESDDDVHKALDAWIDKGKLEKLAILWTRGGDVDWNRLYDGARPRRIHLPTYPFARERYLKSVVSPCTSRRDDSFQPIIYQPVWKPEPLAENHGLKQAKSQKSVVMIVYHSEVKALRDALANVHLNDELIEIRIGDDVSSVKARIASLKTIDRIYFLGGIQPDVTDTHDLKTMEQTQETGVLSLFRFVQSLIQRDMDKPVDMIIVTGNVYPVLVTDRLVPYGGSLAGLAKVAASEYPDKLKLICVDVNPSDDMISSLARQITLETGDPDGRAIAIRGGKRYVRRVEPLVIPWEKTRCFRQHGVYLIAGGCSSIGLALGIYLAEQVQANLILCGRTAYTDLRADQKNKINQIRSKGSDLIYIQGDLADPARMDAVVKESLSRFGCIHGVIHGATVRKDRRLGDMDETDFREALTSKIFGSVVLHHALKGLPLDFMLFFSSVSGSFYGLQGQSNYASANAFLDSFALYLDRIKDYPVSVITCGNTDLGAHASSPVLSAQGIVNIRPEELWEAITCILSGDARHVIALKGDDCFLKAVGVETQSRTKDSFSRMTGRPSGNPGTSGDPEGLTKDYIKGVLADVTGLSPSRIKDNLILGAYGVNSLMSKVLLTRLEKVFGLLPATLFFQYKTVRELSSYFMTSHTARLMEILGDDGATSHAVDIPASPPSSGPNQEPLIESASVEEPINQREKKKDFVDSLTDTDVERLLKGLRDREQKAQGKSGHVPLVRPLTFMFPGLGDHYPGMGTRLYQTEKTFHDIIDRCCNYVQPLLDRDLKEILFAKEHPVEPLDNPQTAFTPLFKPKEKVPDHILDRALFAHPAVFTVEYAMARLWMDKGVRPQAMIGLSLGEYTAACLAGVLSLEDTLRILVKRAQLIETLPQGAMLATLLSEEELRPLLGEGLDIGVIGAPHSCMASGDLGAILALEKTLEGMEKVFKRMPVDRGFHSRQMAPVKAEFIRFLETISFHAPTIPYLSNVTGTWIKDEQATGPDYWFEHLCSTVRFAQGMNLLLKDKDRLFLEVGPGSGLSSFVLQHPEGTHLSERSVMQTLPNHNRAGNHFENDILQRVREAMGSDA